MKKRVTRGKVGGEGGTVGNIWDEVGSIPPYHTFNPPGPKKLTARDSCELNKHTDVNIKTDRKIG